MIRTRCRLGDNSLLSAALLLIFTLLAGCHSRFVDTTVDNRGPKALQMIEVDYPSASFGVGSLAPGAQFHYRFKVQGSGALKLEFTDSQGLIHNVDGPELVEGQEGSLAIAIDPAGNVAWQPNLTRNP
jgi:hypothetical protein